MTVSIIIPTKNAGERFRETLASIRQQRGVSAELIVVDSGSVDNTLAVAREYGARTISIPLDSFNHGETRNLGIREAGGDVCVMLVQDAVPAGEPWLAQLLAPFEEERVVGVTGRQIARHDADLMGRWEIAWGDRFLGAQLGVREVPIWEEFWTWDYDQRLRTAWFNNVCSALRREFWEKHPFRPLPFAEDVDWAMQALAAGYRIVYQPLACVIHSHSRPPAYRMKRQYVADKIMHKLLRAAPADPGVRTDSDFFATMSLLCSEVQARLPEQFRRPEVKAGLGSMLAPWRETWHCFLAASGFGSPHVYYRLADIREHFYDICEQLQALDRSHELAAQADILLFALSQTAGVFTASYYQWAKSHDRLSLEMRRLDAVLSEGVYDCRPTKGVSQSCVASWRFILDFELFECRARAVQPCFGWDRSYKKCAFCGLAPSSPVVWPFLAFPSRGSVIQAVPSVFSGAAVGCVRNGRSSCIL